MVPNYFDHNERRAGSVPLDTVEYTPDLAYIIEEERFETVEELRARVAALLAGLV